MVLKKTKYEVVDYIFWFLLILFSNPGGIFKAFGEDTSISGTIDSFDFIFFLMFGCFLLIVFNSKINNRTYSKLVKHLVFFGLYYFIIFGFLVPIFKETPNYTTLTFLKRSRKTVYNLVLFVIVYRFYIRSFVLFYWTLVLTSILILLLFIISVFTGFEILPITRFNRGFVNIDRMIIASEGLMMLLVPMGVILIVFGIRFKKRFLFLIAFLMIIIIYILAITRRGIIGMLILFFVAFILSNYFENNVLIPIKKILSISLYLIFFGFIITLSFPKYVDAGMTGIEEAVNIIKYGETSSGKIDVRLGFGKEFMQNLILNNPWVGTGFDDKWRGSAGDRLGYETSDYPFLSAIAMTGILGILIFLPIYIILVKALIFDIKFLKKYNINYQSKEFYILIVFVLYFVYDLMQYMNWFSPVSLSRKFAWYIYLAMYFASRQIFYSNIETNRKRTLINQ